MKHSFTPLRCWLSSAFLSLFFISASAQPLLTYTTVRSGLDYPVDIVNPDDGTDRLFIVQQNGVIRLYKASVLTTFMNLSGVVTFSDERGLLSMAFHPDFDGVTNRYFFVYYTTTTANLTTIRLVRYQTVLGNPDLGDPLTANEVLSIDKRATGMHNHNGGKLNFGIDGMLYFGVGDGGGSNDILNSAQDGGFFLGKMLRIDINGSTLATPFYSVPPDNPYVDANDPSQDIRDEIWALGLRNPFRWSFDPLTNAMWIGDVGQGAREEVDVRTPSPTTGGVNYGWRCYEGTVQPPSGIPACTPLPANYVAPVYEYTRNSTTGGFCITGGLVYRGTGSPLLYGHYIFADYISNNVWVRSSTGLITQQPTDLAAVAGFGTDINGELFAVSRGGAAGQGSLISISSSALLPVTLLSFTGKNMAGYNELKWTTSSEQNADRYSIQYSTDGNNFITAGEVAATNNPTGSAYSYLHTNPATGKLYYRLLMRNLDGASRQSSIIVIGGKNNNDIKVYPTVVSNSLLELTANSPVEMIKLVDAGGREVYRSNLNGRQGYFSIQLPDLAKGIYFVIVQGKDSNKTERIIIQ